MTYTKKKILPALHQSGKVSKPDLQDIGTNNYTDTILRYDNLAVKFPELNTNAKTIVAAINEIIVYPNPPETPTYTLNKVKIDNKVYAVSGGSTVIPNPPPPSGALITEDGQIILIESGSELLPEQGAGPTPVYPALVTVSIDGTIYSIAGDYTLPIASADTLGGIKVGAGLAIDSQTGVLSAAGSGVEYYPGRGIFFSDEITEEFYTEAPQESGSGAGLSYTTCPLKYRADTTYGNPVTICHPIRGSLFSGVYDSTTNSVLVTCRDYVPEGTLIQIKYTANIAEANSINADAGRRSSAYTYIQFRTDYMSPKNSWKSTGTYVDGNLVQVSQAITDPPYRCFSWGQLEISGIQDITLYVKQDSINTNTAYILISKPGKTFRVKTTDTFNGDGVTNVFTLSHEVYRPAMAPYVTFEPYGSFPNTVLGNTITFTGSIPPVGTKISVQYYYIDTSSNNVFKSYKGVTTSDYVSCYVDLGDTSAEYYKRVVDILYVKDGDATISNSVAYFYYVAGNAYIGANGEIFNDYDNNYAIGFQSHAEGGSSLAMGNRSHAEGMSKAIGSFSHSEGEDTTALGSNSHAEGEETVASGISSHSEGELTLASGENSHAEGTHTQALGSHSHAEGGSTYAEGIYSHSEGIWTHATGGESHAEGDSTRALSSSAHAEGILTIAEGAYSHAEGSSTKASGASSHAEGNYTQASGYTSHAEGNYSQATAQYSHAEGSNTVASNYYAHAEGNSTEASGGDGAHAEGNDTVASGSSAHAEGTHTQATGAGSHAGGGYSIASGQYSYATGDNTRASGDYSHAEGQTTVATGDRSHAEGYDTNASGNSAHAEGNGTIASNSYAHAEGQNSVASNAVAHAEGYGSTASGYVSHAEGYQTQARATGTHTEGYQTQATQNYAHAEGAYNIASGFESHAEGVHTIAAGNFSHAEGRGLEDALNVAAGIGSHVEGFQSQAIGDASHAEGGGTRAIGQESSSEGAGTWAYGKWSHAEGAGTTVYANYSHVEGAGVDVIKEFSHAEGAGNKCIGGYNHIEGGGNISTNHMSHTEGAGNTNDGPQAHAEGSGNGLSGEESHVEGAGNKIHAPKSHGEGGGNSLYGLGSHVEGKHNEVAGFAVHAEGGWNFVGTNAPITQFLQTTSYNVGDVVGPNSAYVNFSDSMEQTVSQYLYRCITAPGQIQSGNGVEFITPVDWNSSTAYTSGTVILYRTNQSIPLYYYADRDIPAGVIPPISDSVGAGWQRIESILSPFKTTTSSGYYLLNADRLGSNVVAKVASGTTVQAMWEPIPAPKYTHIEGYRNIALGDYQHVGGKFNATDANKSFIIGNGADSDHRSNALTLDWSGNLVVSGDVTTGTTLSTSSQSLAAAINELYGIIPDVSVTQVLPSSGNTKVATITVDSTATDIYAPTPTSVSIDDTLSTGTKVATITIDGTDTEILVPSAGSSVQVTQIQESGTHIADIEVDGVTTELYAPNGGGGAVIDDTVIALDKTWSSSKINSELTSLADRIEAIERYLWGIPLITEDGDQRITEDGSERILEQEE